MLELAWNFSAQVPGGPALSVSNKRPIGALDKAVVTLKNDGTSVTVDLQPSPAAKVLMLVVQSSYEAADVTVEITDVATPTPATTGELSLAQPLILTGAALDLLTGAPLKAVVKFVKGTATKDISTTIELVIARKL